MSRQLAKKPYVRGTNHILLIIIILIAIKHAFERVHFVVRVKRQHGVPSMVAVRAAMHRNMQMTDGIKPNRDIRMNFHRPHTHTRGPWSMGLDSTLFAEQIESYTFDRDGTHTHHTHTFRASHAWIMNATMAAAAASALEAIQNAAHRIFSRLVDSYCSPFAGSMYSMVAGWIDGWN